VRACVHYIGYDNMADNVLYNLQNRYQSVTNDTIMFVDAAILVLIKHEL